ncbi:MAG: hypothetical protein A3J87_04850 [Sideroxydans sp. RIFOXYB12_FULL_59_6]|nr:MAG: hypothetical protein A3J87_04850 [Sideroxydans sp. RIFOXYB12_FULL_59_6]
MESLFALEMLFVMLGVNGLCPLRGLILLLDTGNPHLNPLPEGEEAMALSPSGGKLDRGLAGMTT